MINVVKTFVFLAALLLLPGVALGGNWKNEAGTDLERRTATATNPSTSPIALPGELVYFTHAANGTTPAPLDIKSCQEVIITFHPDYGGNETYTAEAMAWDCQQGAPTLDESVADFDEDDYCVRVLGDINGGALDNLTLNGDDGTDRDGDLLEEQRSKIYNVKGSYLHITHSVDPAGSDTTRITVACSPQTN